MTSELTGRELDAAVAVEVMGFVEIEVEGTQAGRRVLVEPDLPPDVLRLAKTNFPPPENIGPLPRNYWVPNYCRHRGDEDVVEDRIEQRGLIAEYSEHLMAELGSALGREPHCWAIRRATPEQICRAALSAVRGAAK